MTQGTDLKVDLSETIELAVSDHRVIVRSFVAGYYETYGHEHRFECSCGLRSLNTGSLAQAKREGLHHVAETALTALGGAIYSHRS